MRPSFPNLPHPQSEYLLSRLSHFSKRIQGISEVYFVTKLVELRLVSCSNRVIFQQMLQEELLVLQMVLRVACQREFSHLPGGLGRFADSNSIT